MTTIKELVDVYLASRGYKRLKGADEDATPILPLIMMDSAFQLYDKYIKPVKCKHELKKLKNEWVAHYNRFNRSFFRCYNEEQTDFIIEMMDAFEDYIQKDMQIAYIQFTNLFRNEDLERQKILSACMLSNILCQCAEIIHERIYGGVYENKNHDIISCEKTMHKWSDLFYGKEKPSLDPNKDKNITTAVDILCKRQIEFLKLYRK